MRKRYLIQAMMFAVLGSQAALAEEQTAASAAAPAAPSAAASPADQHDKLRTMSPEERRAYLEEVHEQMREQSAASMPEPPPIPAPPGMGIEPSEPPGAEEARARHEQLKAMTPEQRHAHLRAESDKRRAEAEAAAPPMPEPPPMMMTAPGEPRHAQCRRDARPPRGPQGNEP